MVSSTPDRDGIALEQHTQIILTGAVKRGKSTCLKRVPRPAAPRAGAAERVAPPSRPVKMWEEVEGDSDSSVLVAAARQAEEAAVDCLPFSTGGLEGKHAWCAAVVACCGTQCAQAHPST